MSTIRPPAVAGMFYPANPAQLHHDVQAMLARARTEDSAEPPKAVIVPHAGYVYSGPVAASAFARLQKAADKIKRVILLGPCHRVAVAGLATSSADYFATPLGRVRLDRASIDSLASLPQVQEFDLTHQQEHSLEVQLPFLQEVLSDFTLVPLVVGDASAQQVSEVIEALWGGEETLLVISSDLSHYHDYRTAQVMDSATCKAIEHLDAEAINVDMACGRVPVTGLLHAAKHHGLAATTLALCNSGDSAGDKSQVVGYGAWSFS